MALAPFVCIALLLTVIYFLLLLGGEAVGWLVNRIARIREEQQYQKQHAPARST